MKTGGVELRVKWAKRFGMAALSLPIALSVIWALYEVFGMCVNHCATRKQTKTLQINLENEIPDIEILDVHSETGNTSGTGNHVDCLSSVVFSTGMKKTDIEDCMAKYYVIDGWSCCVGEVEDGHYMVRVNASAPFADNIEGH